MTHYFTCPMCAYSAMPYPADEGNICPCCGTEFGYDDTMGVTLRDLRNNWVEAGTPWFSPLEAAPPKWDGVAQLLLNEFDFDFPEDDEEESFTASVIGGRSENAAITYTASWS